MSHAPALNDPSSNEFYKNPLHQTKERLICFGIKQLELIKLTPEEIQAIKAEIYVHDKLNWKQWEHLTGTKSLHELNFLKRLLHGKVTMEWLYPKMTVILHCWLVMDQ